MNSAGSPVVVGSPASPEDWKQRRITPKRARSVFARSGFRPSFMSGIEVDPDGGPVAADPIHALLAFVPAMRLACWLATDVASPLRIAGAANLPFEYLYGFWAGWYGTAPRSAAVGDSEYGLGFTDGCACRSAIQDDEAALPVAGEGGGL
jgi:hypothetical protein